jgi:hypothetical protein
MESRSCCRMRASALGGFEVAGQEVGPEATQFLVFPAGPSPP